MANGLIPPNRALVKQAFNTLTEEGVADWLKLKIKEQLFQIDLVAVDPDMIAAEVISAREESQRIDWFMNQLKELSK